MRLYVGKREIIISWYFFFIKKKWKIQVQKTSTSQLYSHPKPPIICRIINIKYIKIRIKSKNITSWKIRPKSKKINIQIYKNRFFKNFTKKI